MKFTIVVEDTTEGVDFNVTAEHNGTLDNGEQSIACLLAAQMDANLKCAAKLGTLRARTSPIEIIRAR